MKRINLPKLIFYLFSFIAALASIIGYHTEIKKFLVSVLHFLKWLLFKLEFAYFLVAVLLVCFVGWWVKIRRSKAHIYVIEYEPDYGWARLRDLQVDGVKWRIVIPRRGPAQGGLIEFMNGRKPSVDEILREIEVEGPYCPKEECPTLLSVKPSLLRYKYTCDVCQFRTTRKESPAELIRKAKRIARSKYTTYLQNNPAEFSKMLGFVYSD